ncbi:MAG: pirin family protein [Ornithinimicrobium sp.]
MSNLEQRPAEMLCATQGGESVQLITPRDVPLGGPRAMTVRRTLPTRARSLIGPWCFLDHYGPDPVAESGGMAVPRHPHTGLATVSWLFTGQVDHQDSAGHQAVVRPGTVNLMVAGRGISHSEFSTADTTVLHGAQLWFALPEAQRHRAPSFEAFTPEPTAVGDAEVKVFLGALAGSRSPVQMYADGLGAEVVIPPHGSAQVPVAPTSEHGVLVDQGGVSVKGRPLAVHQLAYCPPGSEHLELQAGAEGARLLLLGGPPFGERIVMWWNFVARSHEEIVEAVREWRAEIGVDSSGDDDAETASFGPFGPFPDDSAAPLPAPNLPNARLRSRS